MYTVVAKNGILAQVRKQAPTTKDHCLDCWSRAAVQGGDAGREYGGWVLGFKGESLGAEFELKVQAYYLVELAGES